MQDQANGQKRELVTWAVAIVTLVNAFVVWLAASGDHSPHERAALHDSAPAYEQAAVPLGDVEPDHATATAGRDRSPAEPATPAVMAPHGVELRPMAEPGGLPPALETEQPGH